jgi:antitoxin CptB
MNDLSRIRFLCRRGMKELDVLFQRYLDHRYAAATPEEQAVFLRLLECEDPDIWAWIVGQTPPPVQFADVIDRLQRHD